MAREPMTDDDFRLLYRVREVYWDRLSGLVNATLLSVEPRLRPMLDGLLKEKPGEGKTDDAHRRDVHNEVQGAADSEHPEAVPPHEAEGGGGEAGSVGMTDAERTLLLYVARLMLIVIGEGSKEELALYYAIEDVEKR
jgi:hypothetical protein